MKAKELLKTKWQYIVAFLMPWIFVLIHSVLRGAWPLGGGSLLVGDEGNRYVFLYSELWEQVRNGDLSTFSWISGMGTDWLMNVFRYLMSPFTLLVLLVPKTWIVNMVQVGMILKWSMVTVSTMYFFFHTKHNSLNERKKIVTFMLAMAFSLSNAVLYVLGDLAMLDVLILFPVLLLLEERVAKGEKYVCFYLLLTLSFLFNYTTAIPLAVFLLLWYIIQFDENVKCHVKNVVSYVIVYVAAILTGLVMALPCIVSGVGIVDKSKSSVLSLGEFIQRFFVCDSLWLYQEERPMLYCSVVVTVLSMLYIFTGIAWKKKICVIGMCLLMIIGLITNLANGFSIFNVPVMGAYLLTFLIVFMTMEVIGNLHTIRVWQVLMIGCCSVAATICGFLEAVLLLDFYVYLISFMIVVFVVLMLGFYRKKSIQYKNLLIVFSVLIATEMIPNIYSQLSVYNEYKLENVYYHRNIQNLSTGIELKDGEKCAIAQSLNGYGLMVQQQNTASEHGIVNNEIDGLYKALGMEWSDKASNVFGASPLVNVMFNVRYGFGQSNMIFSDSTQIKSSDNYNLYEMSRLAGVGYMVDDSVLKWDITKQSPFAVQNDFAEKSTGIGDVFQQVKPELSCMSILARNPHEEEQGHVHEEGQVCNEEHLYNEEELYHGEYLEDGRYYYQFQKMYYQDYVNTTFTSDGVSDYYIFIKSSADSITYVTVDDKVVYGDLQGSSQKTLHLGVIPKGKQIIISSDFEIDDFAWGEIWYDIAAYNEEKYNEVYNILASDTMNVLSVDDTNIIGTVEASKNGILMTSIPALEGMKVTVDENETETKVVGEALLGIPLSKGVHNIEIQYCSPYATAGVLPCVIGIVIFMIFIFINKSKKETD